MGSDLATNIRDKIRSGALPLPPDLSAKCCVGMGTQRPCDGCEEPITVEQVEYEFDVDRRTLRFHDQCLAAWREARPERKPESPVESTAAVTQFGADPIEATCAACHLPIKTDDGRYRIRTTQFHTECFDTSPLGVVRRLRLNLGRRNTT